MQYNSQRVHIKYPEYGRMVQEMAIKLLSIPDINTRSSQAQAVINSMEVLSPSLIEKEELKRKLWDHLYDMTDYRLEVISDYPKPDMPNEIAPITKRKLEYNSGNIKFKHYGKNIQKMIEKCIQMQEGEEKTAFINTICSFMKMSYKQFNEDKVSDEMIMNHLRDLSGGKLLVTSFEDLRFWALDAKQPTSVLATQRNNSGASGKKKKKKKPIRNR